VKSDAPARVVVLAPNWLGDLVMAIPAYASLRRLWPDTHLAIAARPSVAPLVPLVEGVDEVLVLEGPGGWRGALSANQGVDTLASGRFDIAVLLPNSFHAALLARRAGIAERWGYRADLRGPLLTRAIARRKSVHHAEYYMALATALGGPPMPLVASLRRDDEAASRATRLLEDRGWTGGRIVVFAPGAAFGSAKRWPPERVGVVAARATRESAITPVLVGAAADREAAADVRAAFTIADGNAGAPLIDLTGETDLRTLAGVLARASAVVSNDSGAMHIAGAVGVPVAGIFGPTNEHRTAPLPHPSHARTAIVSGDAWCRPCELRQCPLDHRCMRGVSVDRVAGALRDLLGPGISAPGAAA
jgi:heptosyltransferase II